MSTLEQILAKADVNVQVNVGASETAQGRILKKFRTGAASCAIMAVIFVAAAVVNVNAESFPRAMKIYIAATVALASVWYLVLYQLLKRIDVASLAPAELFGRTARLKLIFVSGEALFNMALVVFFTIQIPLLWQHNNLGFWLTVVALPVAFGYMAVRAYPQYLRLFRDLNSID